MLQMEFLNIGLPQTIPVLGKQACEPGRFFVRLIASPPYK